MKNIRDFKTVDMFGEPTGLALGHEMAEKAAANAGPTWKEDAYAAFCAFAKTHRHFTVKEVRAANPQIKAPPDLRAWGAVALRAQRAKVVKAVTLWRAVRPDEETG